MKQKQSKFSAQTQGGTLHDVSPRKVGEAWPNERDQSCSQEEDSLSEILPSDKGSSNSIEVSESLTRFCDVTEVVKGDDATKHKYLRYRFKTPFQDFYL